MHARVFVEEVSRLIAPNDSNIEFECRFDMDWTKGRRSKSEVIRSAKKIVTHFSKTHKCWIEQTINFVCVGEGGSKVKQLVFINGQQDKTKKNHYEKKQISNPIYAENNGSSPGYKIQCSLEEPIPEFPAQSCPARVRLRFSSDLGDWRLDLTLVREVDLSTEGLSLLQTVKKQMFDPEINLSNFVESAKWNFSTRIECEVEYVGKIEELTLEKVAQAIDSIPFSDDTKISDYQKMIHWAAKKINPRNAEKFRRNWGVKQLGVQPIELNKVGFLSNILPTIQDFYLTDKVDGQRAIVCVKNGKVFALTDDLEEVKSDINHDKTFIFDTEQYGDGKFYLFDVMVWENEVLVEKKFADRLVFFKDAAKMFPFLRLKKFVSLTNPGFGEQIRQHHEDQKDPEYETDGYIFTENRSYGQMRTFKLKPVRKSSIDFLIKKCPDNMLHLFEVPELGKAKKTNLYILCCGISKTVMRKLRMKRLQMFQGDENKPYLPIQFEPSNHHRAFLWSSGEELDGKIGEFRVPNYRDSHLEYEWELMRLREDRTVEVERGNYFGNNYRVAEMVWMNYQDPLTVKFIIESDGGENEAGYFQVHDSAKHKATRHFNSFVKSEVLARIEPKNVLDLASGKGQDLFRYAKAKVKNAVFTDVDRLALMELINRKHAFAAQRDGHDSMRIQCLRLNLMNKPKENITKLATALDLPVFDAAFCQFAMHYFLKSATSASYIAKLVSKFLRAGAKFVFTAFDGRAIFEKLKDKDEWTIRGEEGEILYSIRKKYNGSVLAAFDQQIDVWLPFSRGYYPEYLVNIDAVASEFAKHALRLKESWGFGDMLGRYSEVNKRGFDEMSEEEKEYSSMYRVFVFERVADGGSRRRPKYKMQKV
jgi:hypothetical protein